MTHAYELSLGAVLLAFSFAILRSAVLRPAVVIPVGLIGVLLVAYVISNRRHRSESDWNRVGQIRVEPQRADTAEGESAFSLANSPVARGLLIRRDAQISTDIFVPSLAGVPANQAEIHIPAGAKFHVAGWAADSERGSPCKSVYIVVDKRRLILPYGFDRADVAAYFHDQAYALTGYDAQVPTDRLSKGKHLVNFQCLSADGRTLFVSNIAHTVFIE